MKATQNQWSKGIVYWRDGQTLYVSVVFTWHLPEAKRLCQCYAAAGYRVVVGGPAVELMPDYLPFERSDEPVSPEPVRRHNPDATFTTRGCIRRCSFCAVPKVEGAFRELPDFRPAPIVCDNNLLAASRTHFDRVVDCLKPLPDVDFNQGLDARLLTDYHVGRLLELKLKAIRFSWDNVGEEFVVRGAVAKVRAAGFPKSRIQVYVLVNHGETFGEAWSRMETLRADGVRMWPMRYQPLDSLKKDSYVAPEWDARELHRFTRYWSRQNWFSKVPYEEFNNNR